MLQKALIATIALGAILIVFCKVLYDKVGELEKANETLQRALESNLEATREKELRSSNDIKQLQQQLEQLSKIDSDCLSSPITDDLVVFLQQLQQDSAGTLSITITK